MVASTLHASERRNDTKDEPMIFFKARFPQSRSRGYQNLDVLGRNRPAIERSKRAGPSQDEYLNLGSSEKVDTGRRKME